LSDRRRPSHEAPAIVGAQPRGTLAELRSIASLRVVRRTWVALAVLVLLATGVNVASLASHGAAGAALDALTAVNVSVFFALVLGVILSNEYPPRSIGSVVGRRRLLGAHGRTAGLAGVITAFGYGALAAAVALSLLHARGIAAPRIGSIIGYVDREAVAAARLATLGVAIGAVFRRRRVGLLVLVAFLLGDWILESVSSFIRDYGPVSAINAFSDPTHRHLLSTGAAGVIAVAWAILALIAASLILETQIETEERP
jgi:hypothetical protein